MQKYKEINGNDYVKNSRTTINETMQSIQSMNSGTAFPTNNLFEGMKCYRTDLKKTYTLTDVENNTWVEDAHATLSDEATHAASATKLQTARSLNLGGAVTADAATFDGTANATINVKTLDATKLKGTASVSTTGNAATATKVVTTAAAGTSANIAEARMASNDLARIRVSGETNAGELALETADDGSEPIVARQYTGIYTTPVRTAKILDESGNTSFPGTVVAPKFTGALNGNAATATKLQTPRTLSLTGKASGSATFDGAANASINVTSVNADTASKLSTARKINITGNATGAATFDGSGDININTTVNESKHAAAATTVNATAPNGGAADLAFGTMAVNDYARIRVYGKDDTGALEIATADGGNEPIYARQYSGAYDWPNGRPGTVTNEAAILDSNGNTKFPKNVTAASFTGPLKGNADTATKLATPRTISLTGNASGSANFDGSGNVSINTTVNESKHAAAADSATTATNANKLASESGSNYLDINTTTDSWSVLGSNPGSWLKSIRTEASAPAYSIGGFSAAIAFGGGDTKGIITHAYGEPLVKFAGGNGSTAGWKFSIYGGYNNEVYDLNNFPTKTGGGASGTWGINISGNADNATKWNGIIDDHTTENNSATWIPVYLGSKMQHIDRTKMTVGNADTVDGYHASDIINKISAANTGGIVAASLTENGYAKFANGLILQWGYCGAKSYATFPIAFSSFARVVCTCDNGNWPWVSGISTKGFTVQGDGSVCWLAIGM